MRKEKFLAPFLLQKRPCFDLLIPGHSQVAMAKVMEQGPVLVLTFMVQQIMILRDAVGNIVEGGEVSRCIKHLKTLVKFFLFIRRV